MFKQFVALTFLLSFGFQLFSKALIVVDYYANTAYFARNCENKARPQMHCNGKCQLMKKLKQEEKKDQQDPERRAENKNETAISSKSFFTTIVLTETQFESSYTDISCTKEVKMPRSIFHPPGA